MSEPLSITHNERYRFGAVNLTFMWKKMVKRGTQSMWHNEAWTFESSKLNYVECNKENRWLAEI